MKKLMPIFLLLTILSCGTDLNPNENTIALDAEAFKKITKYQPGDPFIKTMKESEFFEVSGLTDNVVETVGGTIISVPKGAFRNSKGEIVEKEIKIEITDLNSFEEQFNSNINSPAGQDIMLNGGAVFINATANGAQLALNKDAPIYMELPQESEPDLLVFEGIRNEKGEMQWINPVQPKKYLIPVDLASLDFLPPGFANRVHLSMPFGDYKTANNKLIDSLYYSLKKIDAGHSTDMESESFLNKIKENIRKTMNTSTHNFGGGNFQRNHGSAAAGGLCAAINPVSIKTIKHKKFSKSFIATKQFEERIKTIHESKKQKVLEVYINNLGKDLSYCDNLASKQFGTGTPFEMKFTAYSRENWTNLKNLPRSVKRLGKYYTSKLSKLEKELLEIKQKYKKSLKVKSDKAEKLRTEYKQILTKRQSYRLKKHGFTVTKLGWKCTGKKIKPLWIQLKVNNGDQYDRVLVYTIDPSIKSIFAWRTTNKIDFKYAFKEDHILVFKEDQKAKALAVAYKGDEQYYDLQKFTASDKVNIDFNLKPTSKKALDKLLNKLDNGSKNFNKLKVDLEYQAAFYKEKRRLDKLLHDRTVINNLTYFIHQCPPYGLLSE